MKIEEEIKQKKPISPQTKSIINIIYTSSLIHVEMKKVLKEFNLNTSQFNVLRILKGKEGKPVNCNEVKNVLIDKSSDFTRICDKLVKVKMINRTKNKKNRREILLEINPNGIETLKKINPIIESINKKFDFLSVQEHEKLSELLDKFRG